MIWTDEIDPRIIKDSNGEILNPGDYVMYKGGTSKDPRYYKMFIYFCLTNWRFGLCYDYCVERYKMTPVCHTGYANKWWTPALSKKLVKIKDLQEN